MSDQAPKRLNKYISDTGLCSRREADKLIEQNRVTVNNQPPELGTKVGPGDTVKVDGKVVGAVASDKSDRVYIVYNKPIGITCTTERHVKGNIIDAIGHKERIFPVGRLDKPSEGLIILTSDGDIVNKILRAENAHDKELGTVTKPCVVKPTGKNKFTIILTQGLNRQIRRMCEFLGYEVTKLKRTRIMHLELGSLKPGQWRNLTSRELAIMQNAVRTSSKTASNAELRK